MNCRAWALKPLDRKAVGGLLHAIAQARAEDWEMRSGEQRQVPMAEVAGVLAGNR